MGTGSLGLAHALTFVIPRGCDFIGFAQKPMLKTKSLGASKRSLGASKSAKNQ
jgi:hypothetical protein